MFARQVSKEAPRHQKCAACDACGAGAAAATAGAAGGKGAKAKGTKAAKGPGHAVKVEVLMLEYTGSNCAGDCHAQSSNHVSVVGDPRRAPTVRLQLHDGKTGKGKTGRIFTGSTKNGPKGMATSPTLAIGGTTTLSRVPGKAHTYVAIHDMDGTLLSTVRFQASCKQPLLLGDEFGSLKVVGFANSAGFLGDYNSTAQECRRCKDEACSSCTPGVTATAAAPSTAAPASTSMAAASNKGKKGKKGGKSSKAGKSFKPPAAAPGITTTATAPSTAAPASTSKATASKKGKKGGKSSKGGKSYKSPKAAAPIVTTAAAVQESDTCDVCGTGTAAPTTSMHAGAHGAKQAKPAKGGASKAKVEALVLEYTGKNCAGDCHAQSPNHVSVVGDPGRAPTVRLELHDGKTGKGKKGSIFRGKGPKGMATSPTLAIGGTTTLSRVPGKAHTYVAIHDMDGTLLSTVRFQASCKQPLLLGDEFGSLKVVGFANSAGATEKNCSGYIPTITGAIAVTSQTSRALELVEMAKLNTGFGYLYNKVFTDRPDTFASLGDFNGLGSGTQYVRPPHDDQSTPSSSLMCKRSRAHAPVRPCACPPRMPSLTPWQCGKHDGGDC